MSLKTDTASAVSGLNDILSSVALGREDMVGVVRNAVRLQAGKGDYLGADAAAATATAASTAAATATAAAAAAILQPPSGPLVLSHWALDAAICSYLKLPMPRLGQLPSNPYPQP